MNSINIVDINKIKENNANPRLIKDDKFLKLVNSIKELPEMLSIRPIVVNAEMMVLGGNMRLKACKAAGLKQVPIIIADNLTEEKQKEFIIKDNVGFGEWDWEILANEWNDNDLEEWGLDVYNWAAGHDINSMSDSDVDLTEEFDPIGKMDGKHRVVFLFDGEEEAESYLLSIGVKFKKANIAWQVDMTTRIL